MWEILELAANVYKIQADVEDGCINTTKVARGRGTQGKVCVVCVGQVGKAHNIVSGVLSNNTGKCNWYG